MIGRVFQIYTNFKNRSTGQLSFLMMLMFAMGCAARVFTTLQEVDDTLVLAMFLCNLVFNFIIVIQILLYWNSGKKKSD
jgi:mannose-P-dolichol utilization defect 1